MTRDEFIAQYVIAFCAAWSAREFDKALARSEAHSIEQPVEEATNLAELAWQVYQGML